MTQPVEREKASISGRGVDLWRREWVSEASLSTGAQQRGAARGRQGSCEGLMTKWNLHPLGNSGSCSANMVHDQISVF